jgi:hypothetical protein
VPTERRSGFLVQRPTKWGWFTRTDFRIRQETRLVPIGLTDAVTGEQVHVLLDRGQLADMAKTGQPPEGYNLPGQRENVS